MSVTLAPRDSLWEHATATRFDVVIVGGGINGACLFSSLCQAGYRTLLIDRGDFGSGTSQASGMMIWGGGMYLRNGDARTVWRLCQARDALIRDRPASAQPMEMRYLLPHAPRRHAWLMWGAFHAYWLFGGGRRRRPRIESDFPERPLLAAPEHWNSLVYEEGFVTDSDARFVLQWLAQTPEYDQIALNYCTLLSGGYDSAARCWQLEVQDTLRHATGVLCARWVINATGVWVDSLNKTFHRSSPYRHVLSKGVFVNIPRLPGHQSPLILKTRKKHDYISLIPWGPVSVWGPTETLVDSLDEGLEPAHGDIAYLMDEFRHWMSPDYECTDIISFRCGIRPLGVPHGYAGSLSSLELSRHPRAHIDPDVPWISVYGGKLTDGALVARSVLDKLRSQIPPLHPERQEPAGLPVCDTWMTFPGLDAPIPSPDWCRRYELCGTLEDYLRRRTNIAQWVPVGGLGRSDEFFQHLCDIAHTFHDNPGEAVRLYRKKISDTLLRAGAPAVRNDP